MKDVTYSTGSEKRMFQAIQRAIGAYDNGVIGAQTMSDVAAVVKADCFPITLQIYGYPVIIGNDILAFDPNGGLKSYNNSLSGSFTYPSGQKPCSILVNKGQAVYSAACHAHIGKPESVLYRLDSGVFGVKKCKSTADLPANVRWAVGGMGLLSAYDPAGEGFSGAYSDVLRKTNHTVLAVKNDKVYGVYYKNMTAAQINAHCRDKMQFDYAIMLDGGHIAAINGAESFAKINTSQVQGYGIQFI